MHASCSSGTPGRMSNGTMHASCSSGTPGRMSHEWSKCDRAERPMQVEVMIDGHGAAGDG